MSEHEKASFFDRLQKGLRESIAHAQGKLKLVSTETTPCKPRATGKSKARRAGKRGRQRRGPE